MSSYFEVECDHSLRNTQAVGRGSNRLCNVGIHRAEPVAADEVWPCVRGKRQPLLGPSYAAAVGKCFHRPDYQGSCTLGVVVAAVE